MARDSNAQFPAGGPKAGGPSPAEPADTGSIHRGGSAGRSSGDESKEVSPFELGDTLAGRYKIKRFLGRGGMGEVFEVEDLVLHSSVALKTIHPKEADRSGAIERFKREINVARRVTHPNVCRLFDVGSHQVVSSDGKTRETLFLTMEMLEGENLADRISRGRIPIEEALPILNGMAQGLGAAHRAGVLHRDFKAANVMIGSSTDSGRNRAVVTDFGLARTIEREEGLASLSDSGVVVGTPAYMSPEQVRGDALTSASDIYALGLVMYEMVTGKRPFSGGSAWSIAVRRLTEEPPQPRAVVPDLDPAWDAAINACLQIDPEQRPRTPEDVVAMVKTSHRDDETHAIRSSPRAVSKNAAPPIAVESPKDWMRDRRVWAGGAGLVLLLAVSLYVSSRQTPTGSTPAEGSPAPAAAATLVKLRPSVVLLGITNASQDPDLDWLGTATSEILNATLSIDPKLRVLPAQETLRATRELDISPGLPAPSQLARLRVLLGVDFAVIGTAAPLGSGEDRLIRLELTLLDLATGRTVPPSQATGPATALHDLVERGSEDVRKALKSAPLTPDGTGHIRAAWPTDMGSSRFTATGLLKFRKADFAGARTDFEKAAELSSEDSVPRSGLAQALLSLGNAARAKEEAERALVLTDKLSPENKLWVNAQLQEIGRQWKEAASTYGSLVALAPDNIDYGLKLAEAQASGGAAKEALQTIDTLRALPKPLSDDPRLDLVAARAYQRLGDSKQQLAFATSAAQKATRHNARLVAANAKILESIAQDALGDRAASGRASEEATRLFEAAGDKTGLARALERVANSIFRGGDLEGSRKLFERALTLHTEMGDNLGMSRARLNLANIAYRQGNATRADKLDAEALATFRQVGAKSEMASALNNIASRLHRSGDLAGAQKKYNEALLVFIEIGDRRRTATLLTNLAEVMATRGDLKDAETPLNDSLATWRELGEQGEVAYVLARLGDLAYARGDLIVARDRLDEAVRIQQELKERLTLAETKLSIARTALASGKAAEAETIAREAEEVLRSEKAADSQTLASLLIVESQLAQNKGVEARKALEPLAATAAASSNADVRVTFAILKAHVDAAGGDVACAITSLDRARQAAAKDKLVDHEFRIRLAAGEIEMKGGREKAGRARLQALAKEAEAKGFGLVARKARESTAPTP